MHADGKRRSIAGVAQVRLALTDDVGWDHSRRKIMQWISPITSAEHTRQRELSLGRAVFLNSARGHPCVY
jgi:hypothetical protein